MAVQQFSMLNFKTAKSCEGAYMIENYKTTVVLSKTRYVGCAALDLSKLTMLQLHYHVIEKHLEHQHTLHYSDTDSFVYNTKHPDMYEWIKENKEHFALSYYKGEGMRDNKHKKT